MKNDNENWKVQVNVYLDRDQYAEIEAMRHEREISLSAALRDLITEGLEAAQGGGNGHSQG